MLNVLLIGGSGFLGRYVESNLFNNGYSIRSLDQQDSRNGKPYYKGSLFDRSLIKEAVGWSDVVVHLAAVANVNLVNDNPQECLHVNIQGTVEVIEAIRKIKMQPMIFASTYFTCAQSGGGLYATSKLSCENILKDYSTMYELDTRVVRLGSLYGEYSRGDDVITKFSESMLDKNEINIYGDGMQRRAYIHGIDAAQAINSAIQYKAHKGYFSLFYILGNTFLSINQLALKFKAISPSLEINHIAQREYDVSDIVINLDIIAESNKKLKWEPLIDIDSGIHRIVNFLKER